MNFGGLAGLSNVYPGYVAGERAQVGLGQEQEALKQSKIRTQDALDTQQGVAALASIFGVAAPIPPNAPPPMAPGQVSQPAQAANMPAGNAPPPPPPMTAPVPPGQVAPTPAAAPAGGVPSGTGAPPLSAPPPAPAAAPPPPPNGAAAGAPPAGAVPPGGTVTPATRPPSASAPAQAAAAAYGQMTYDDIARRIRARNPNLSPGAFGKAMQAAVPFMNAESKIEFATLSLQQKIDAAQMRYDLGEKTLATRQALLDQANQFRLQIETMKQNGADRRQTEKLDSALTMLLDRLEQQSSESEKTRKFKESEADKNRKQQIIRDLGKYGAKDIDPDAPLADLEKQLGTAKQEQEQRAGDLKLKLNEGAPISDTDYKFLGQQLAKGDTTALQGWGYGKSGASVRARIRDEAIKVYKEENSDATGADMAAARAGFTAQIAAARTLGTREGALAGTVAELDPLGDLLLKSSAKIDRSKYPSVNSILLAAKRQEGDPEVVRYGEALQGFMTAYASTMSRTGRTTDYSMRRANSILTENYNKGQITAGVDQLKKEADAILKAQKSATQSVVRDISGRAPAAAAPDAAGDGGDTVIKYDAEGNPVQ